MNPPDVPGLWTRDDDDDPPRENPEEDDDEDDTGDEDVMPIDRPRKVPVDRTVNRWETWT